jgi:hypothetical protein
MKKEEIRKEYFHLRIKGHSQNQCRKILLAQFGFEVSKRTLQRWTKNLNETEWDLKDKSRKPKIIHTKINFEIERKVVNLRNKTGWGENKLATRFPDLSHKIINKILNKYNLTNPNPRRKKRLKYIRWQRKHPNSLWQMDVSDQKIKDKYSKFDRWCKRREIKHIRTAIHSPTTTGKIERFFQTLAKELGFCKNAEHFRMRYNHFRPHTSLEGKTPAEVYFRG